MLTLEKTGARQTYSGLVRPWECDENEHLNLTFYIRAFQHASEALAADVLRANPGAASASLRHMRFHRELRVSQTFAIDSVVIRGGEHNGRILHLLRSNGHICASALDLPGFSTEKVPVLGVAEVLPSFTRGLSSAPSSVSSSQCDPRTMMTLKLGVVRPHELDHVGQLQMHEIFSYCTLASLHILGDIVGLSPEWKKVSGCTHMGVEVKITRHRECKAGDVLSSRSWLASVGEKSLVLRHCVYDHLGSPVASVEQVLVIVDFKERRVVPVPLFVRAYLST